MKLLKSKSEIFESLIVYGFLLVILLPVRILFVRYVADSWLGSLGVLTLVYLILILLIKKNKLGKFGRMISRQLFKINKGKRKYFVYTNVAIGILFFSTVVYGMESAKDDYYTNEINRVLGLLPEQNLTNPEEAEKYMKTELPKISLTDLPQTIMTLIFLPFTNHDQFIILWGVTDKITDGWLLNLSIIILAEQIEVVGFLIAIKFIIKEDYFTQKTV